MVKNPIRLTLIFDGTCGFCTRSARLVRALDRHDRVQVVPSQASGTGGRFGLSAADLEQAAWAIGSDGEKYRGAAAVQMALGVALGTPLPYALYRLPVMRQVQDGIYALVSRYRGRLPGDTPYCERYPDACGDVA